MSVIRRAGRWLWGHPYAISVIILAAGIIVSFAYDRHQDDLRDEDRAAARVELHVAQAITNCETTNTTNQTVREIGVDLSVSNAEALIQVVGASVDPADVEAYRRFIRENAEQTVSVLGKLDCEAEAEAARDQATQIEDAA